MLLVYITCASENEAKKIAKELLKKRLIACANVILKLSSMYWWEGKLEESTEALLICKTAERKETQIIKLVQKIHSYELPGIEFVKAKANKKFEEWIKKEVRGLS